MISFPPHLPSEDVPLQPDATPQSPERTLHEFQDDTDQREPEETLDGATHDGDTPMHEAEMDVDSIELEEDLRVS